MNIKGVFSIVLMIVVVLILLSTSTSKSIDGGTWDTKSGLVVTSAYMHETETHKTTIHNNSTGEVTCQQAEKGEWAKVTQFQTVGDQIAEASLGTC